MKIIVPLVGYLQELYQNARSTEHKILSLILQMKAEYFRNFGTTDPKVKTEHVRDSYLSVGLFCSYVI
jgi:hypothetical protein